MWVGPIPGRTSGEGVPFILFLFDEFAANLQLYGGDGGKRLGFPAGPRWMRTGFGGEIQRREKPAAVVAQPGLDAAG